METSPRKPGYAALRQFRESKPGSLYFVTCNLGERGHGFGTAEMIERITAAWGKLETDGHWLVRTGVVMPDHLHLLIHLKDKGTLAECMRLLKGRLAGDLRGKALRWQEGFYEHRIRDAESLLPVFLYIYLNPYRAGLLSENMVWAGYFCCAEDWAWFGAMTRESVPQPEWLL